jgi:hypothetical protein
MASSDNEQGQQEVDQHSIWNGRLKTNTKEAKFFLELLDALGARFDGMPVEDILTTFWGEPRDVLEKLIKKANKREKKAVAKFTPEGLKKPSNANILFQRDFKIKCEKNGTKFDLKSSAEAYKKLSEKDKSKYMKEAERLKSEYKVEYDRLRAEAISSGSFPDDKPKKPMTAYFRYLQEVRAELQAKYIDDVDRKAVNGKVAKDSADMWKSLSDKEKDKYESAYRREKEQYEEVIKRWESTETARRKTQDATNVANSSSAKSKSKTQSQDTGAAAAAAAAAAEEPVKIETSGAEKKKVASKKQVAAPEPSSATQSEAEASASETEDSTPVEVKKPVAKAKSGKSAAVPKAISESEQEEEEVIPKTKTTGKAKAK